MSASDNVLRASLDTSGFTRGQLDINSSLELIQQQLQKTEQTAKASEASFSTLGAAASALAGIMGSLIGSFSIEKLIEVNSTYNRLSVEMNTVTGSAAGAQAAIQNLIQFSNNTPYTLDQVSDAFIRLRNAGLDASNGMLSSLSNVASSIGRPIGDITDAIASAAVGNTEMLRGFGIESQQAGNRITMTFQGISQTIDRTGPAIEKYIAMLGNTTFEGDTARQAQTISGRMTTLEDSVENVLRAVGDGGFNDAFKGLLTDLTGANNSAQGLARTIGGELGAAINGARTVWEQYGTEVNAVLVGLTSIVAVGSGLRTVTTIMGVLSGVVSPIPLAIGAAATALVLFHDKTISLGGQPTTVVQGLKDFWSGISGYISSAASGVERYIQATQRLHSQGDGNQRSDGGDDAKWYTHPDKWLANEIVGGINGIVRYGRERREGQEASDRADQLNGTDFQSHGPSPVISYPTAMQSTLPSTDNMLRAGLLSAGSTDYLKSHPDVYNAAAAAAQRNGIPLNFFLKLLDTESGGLSDEHARVRSPTGAIGFGQVLPSTAARPGYVPAFHGDLTNPIDNINFSADYLAARARKEQGTDNPDWVWAARSYGTTSLAGNLGNVPHMIAASQALTAALRMDKGYQTYADNGIHMDPQSQALIAQDQMQVGTNTDYGIGYGARRAMTQQMVQGGYAVPINDNDPDAGMRSMTEQEMLAASQRQNWTPDRVAGYYRIARMAPAAYNAQIDHTQDAAQSAVSNTDSVAAFVGISKSMEIIANSQEAVRQAIQQGQSPGQAQRAGDIASGQAWGAIRLQNAQQVQSSRLSTSQTTEQNRAIAGQGVYWDPVSASYILDTRGTDALQIQHQIDPYGVNPSSAGIARSQADAQWGTLRAQESAQDRLSEISQSDPIAGLKSGWKEFQDQFNDVNADMKTTFTDTMEGMTSSMVKFITTGRGGWKELADSVVTDITTMSVHYLESAIFKYAGNMLSGWMGGTGTTGGTTANAMGGVYASGLSAYSGSIVTSPTYFAGTPGARYADGASLMGEAGPEAIMPLKRGADGKLGIAGASGGDTHINLGGMVINNPTTDDGGKLNAKQAAALNAQLSGLVSQQIQRTLTNQQRPGGMLHGTGR